MIVNKCIFLYNENVIGVEKFYIKSEKCESLEQEHNRGNISEYERNTIIDLSISIVRSIAKKYETIKKEISGYMGGKVLNYPTKELYNQARKEGVKEGQQTGRSIEMSNIIGIIRKKLIKGMTVQDITELLEFNSDYISSVASLIEHNPQKSDLEIAKIICEVDE